MTMPSAAAAVIEALPRRYRAPSAETSARFRVRVDRTVRDVVVEGSACRVEKPSGVPLTEICTDLATWKAIDGGRLSGIEAFTARKLKVRGSIEGALAFEPLFERPARGGFVYSLEVVKVGRAGVSALVAGPEDGEPLLLLHGLGGTKASWLTVIPQLAETYRVYAVDIPGFGASSKPVGRYDAPWFAGRMFELADALGYDRFHVAGNSMGGRIAQEMAMRRPDRVQAIVCLCPATAFSYRPAVQLVRLLRPEFGMLVGRLPRARLSRELRLLFADPKRIDEAWYEAAIDDFLRIWRSPRARMAFFAAARNIYLDEPHGDGGFWARLKELDVDALYVFGDHDVLITPRFAAKVSRTLPGAGVEVWKDCGHVPQLEYPQRTAEAMLGFLGRATGRPVPGSSTAVRAP